MPKRYPGEFRRKDLDLVAAGRPVQPRQLRKDPHTGYAARSRLTTNPVSNNRGQGPLADVRDEDGRSASSRNSRKSPRNREPVEYDHLGARVDYHG